MNHPIKRPTFDEHIKELFTDDGAGSDVSCMMAQGVDLRTYDGVKASAAKISEWIGSGRMPPPTSGRSWSAEKLQTFRNWAGNSGYAERPFVRIQPSENTRVRRSVHELEDGSEELNLLKKAFKGLMDRDADLSDPKSFFNLAGIHWLPGPVENTFCRHHDDAYNPWHRAYLHAFEDALRSVDGCENVTLPFWDILGKELPDWIFKPPFYPYEFPHQLVSLNGVDTYKAGDPILRDSASQIAQNVQDASANIEVKIGEALSANQWRGFNGWSDWPNQHEGIIRAHDNGHGACGETIANPDVAAFDPLFWFFHCNWDRLWWKWQEDKNTTSLLAFKSVVTGDTHWLSETPETILAPFDVNSAEMINLTDWNIEYENPAEEEINFDEMILASRGNTEAARSFSVHTTERYSVRIKDINRLDIPGSFTLALYSGENVLAKTRIFQPSSPRDCANCTKHAVFSTDFIVERSEFLSESSLRVAIEVSDGSGGLQEIPISQAGNPTINIRLLLNSK